MNRQISRSISFTWPGFISTNKVALVAAFLLTLQLILVRIAGFNGLYGQDSYEYLRYTKSLIHFFQTWVSPGDYFWPLMYPLYGAAFSLLTRDPAFALQLISIVSYLLSFLYLIKIFQDIFPDGKDDSIVYLVLFFCLSPFLFRSALLVMPDSLTVFFILAGFYHSICYTKTLTGRNFLLAIFFSISAMMTRYAAAVLIALYFIILVWKFWTHFNWKQLLLALLVVGICILPHLWIRGGYPASFLHHNWIELWSFKNWFLKSFDTPDGKAINPLPNLVYSFLNFIHPGYLVIGVIFLLFLKQSDFVQKGFIFLLVSFYAIFLAGIPFQSLRFLQLSFPFVIIGLYHPFLRIKEKYLNENFVWIIFCGIVILIQSLLFVKYFTGILQLNRFEKQMTQVIMHYPRRTLYTFSIDGALKSYGVENKIINLWSEKFNQAETNSMVLFNENKFKFQWEKRNPMVNWNFLKENYRLIKIETFANGWELFEIK